MFLLPSVPDTIRDNLIGIVGESCIDDFRLQDEKIRTNEIYIRLTKSRYHDDLSEELSSSYVIAMLLLHYRYITAEQVHLLFPKMPANRLSKLTALSKRTNSACKYHLMCDQLVGHEKVYYLDPAVHNEMYLSLSPEYTRQLRIPPESDVRINRNTPHQTAMLTIPYKMLADDRFMYFDWHTKLPLEPNVDILSTIKNYTYGSGEELQSNAGLKKPDGLIRFLNEERYLCLEQDMGTESFNIISDKNAFYGDYFASQRRCASVSTVMFNASERHARKNGHVLSRNIRARSQRMEKGMKKLRQLMTERDLPTVSAVLRYIESTLAQEHLLPSADSTEVRELTLARAVANDYIRAHADNGHDAALTAIEGYVFREIAKRQQAVCAIDESKNQRHVQMLYAKTKERLSDEADASYAGLRHAIASYGLSYIFSTASLFVDKGIYLLPRESGYINLIISRIIKGGFDRHCPAGTTFRYAPIGQVIPDNPYIMRNCITSVSSSGDVSSATFVEEISHDIGGLVRAQKLFEKNIRSKRRARIILLCDGFADAEAFVRDNDIIHRYCNASNKTAPNVNNIQIGFIDYSQEDSDMTLFMPVDGKKQLFSF